GPFEYKADRFADLQVLRYRVPGLEELTLRPKELAYCLTQAGLEGRDIFWDQKYRHNLTVRKTLEAILNTYNGDRSGPQWEAFLTYAKQVFFSNGIHHHYASSKILPQFTPDYLVTLLNGTEKVRLPLQGKSVESFAQALTPILFDPDVDGRSVNVDADVDNVAASAMNFYRGVTSAEVEEFYAKKKAEGDPRLSYGLNSQVVKENGRLVERVWKVGGMYGPAIEKIVGWLEKALPVAESDLQRQSIQHLINYYRTGDLAEFDQHAITWVADTESRIDF